VSSKADVLRAPDNARKRKREDLDESDPKLREFLETMRPGYKAARTQDGTTDGNEEPDMAVIQAEDPSDDEYEAIPHREPKRRAHTDHEQDSKEPSHPSVSEAVVPVIPEDPPARDREPELRNQHDSGVTDDDWLRVRTNRLLDLVDAEDLPTGADSAREATDLQVPSPDDAPGDAAEEKNETPVQARDTLALTEADLDADVEAVQKTSRLFVRNLPYSASEDDVRGFFQSFGTVEEVRKAHVPYLLTYLHATPS